MEKHTAATYQGSPCKRGNVGIRRITGGDCVECNKDRARERWNREPGYKDKWLQKRRDSYATSGGREYRRERNLMAKFGMTIQDYDAIFVAQNGLCACCGGPPIGKHKRLDVDHCHRSGKVRALLCHLCNVGLGSFQDDPIRLFKAAEYLKRHAT